MKRPLLCMGAMFVLGELAYRLAEESLIYSALATISAIVVMKISGKSAHNKCSDLLLFSFTRKCEVISEISSLKKYLFPILFLIIFVLGILWGFAYYREMSGTLAAECGSGKKVEMTAYISKVEEKETGTRVTLKTSQGGLTMYVKSKDNSGENHILEPGHYIHVTGCVEEIQGRTNPGGVDMEEYYAGKGIRYQLESPEYTITKDRENRLVNGLYHIRLKMGERLDQAFDEEEAGILKTMLLGDKSSLSSEVRTLYQRCGIVHILAISGLHVMLLAGVLEWLLQMLRVRKNISVCITIIFATLYGVLTGMSEATLRAVIMLIIMRIAFLFGRTSDMPTSMMEALLIMLILNPDSLLSTGLLMSFMAVLGVLTGNVIGGYLFDRSSFEGLPSMWKMRFKTFFKGLLISASINIWMCPLIMRSYYEVPILSLLLNIIVIPLLTVVVACGFIVMLLGNIAVPAIRICEKLLWLYKSLCQVVLKIPGAIFPTGHLEIWQLILTYLVFGAAMIGIVYVLEKHLYVVTQKLGKRWRAKTFTLVMIIFAGLSFGTMGMVKLGNEIPPHIDFLDVGQGDCSIIHEGYSVFDNSNTVNNSFISKNKFFSKIFSKNRNYIVDSGSTSYDSVGQYTLIPALKYYGMTHIRCIFISHMDEDHMNAVVYLLENRDLYGFTIDYLAVAEATEVDENYGELLSVLGETELIELGAGDVVDGSFQVLYPFKGCEPGSGNDHSLVLDMRFRDVEVLYTGDISSEVEHQIVEKYQEGIPFFKEEDLEGSIVKEESSVPKESSVSKESSLREEEVEMKILKCPHHGSRYSSSTEFLRWYAPDLTVISCGENNTYGHPHRETLERIRENDIEFLRTDQSGAVKISCSY